MAGIARLVLNTAEVGVIVGVSTGGIKVEGGEKEVVEKEVVVEGEVRRVEVGGVGETGGAVDEIKEDILPAVTLLPPSTAKILKKKELLQNHRTRSFRLRPQHQIINLILYYY